MFVVQPLPDIVKIEWTAFCDGAVSAAALLHTVRPFVRLDACQVSPTSDAKSVRVGRRGGIEGSPRFYRPGLRDLPGRRIQANPRGCELRGLRCAFEPSGLTIAR